MRALLLVSMLTALTASAAAQDRGWAPQPAYDSDGVVETEAPQREREVGGFSLTPRGIYLTSLGVEGGEFAGFEIAVGGWVWLEGPVALVLRGRAASYLTLRSPAGELDDTACSGGYYFSFCGGDADWLALGAGGELGLRFEHRESMGPVEVALGGELLLSGTGYLATFEHVREGGSLGGEGSLFVDLFIRERGSPAVRGRSARFPSGRQIIVSAVSGSPSGRRAGTPAGFSIGLEVGARVEAGIRGPDRAALDGGLRLTFRP